MTRFARAKGSKASNERKEEEATPWHVMRQQLAEQLTNHQAQSENKTSYNLKEILNNGTNAQSEEVWSNFGDEKSNMKKQLKLNKEKNCNDEYKIKEITINNNEDAIRVLSRNSNNKQKINVTKVNESSLLKDSKFKKKNLQHPNNTSMQSNSSKVSVSSWGTKFRVENVETLSDNSKKRKVEVGETGIEDDCNSKKHRFEYIENDEVKSGNNLTKKQKKKLHVKSTFVGSRLKSKDEVKSSAEKSTTPLKNAESLVKSEKLGVNKKAKHRIESDTVVMENSGDMSNDFQRPSKNSKIMFNNPSNEEKSSKVGNGNFESCKKNHSTHLEITNKSSNNLGNYNFHDNHVKKNPISRFKHDNSFQTIIANGREIHVVQYQGFPVKKEDAMELRRLRKKLVAQKIPKEKLETIMKLERRKAEKALAREKKKVCYHCRQFGHNFSNCPDIKDSDMVKTGVCFKCGSLEHSHFECKVLQRQEFRHAVCFVCKEQGHIARQCPLNSQGQYPKGGSCHLCGEVTHLRKDCPKAVEEKVNKSVTVDTITDGKVEVMDGQMIQRREMETKKNKIIKFK